MKLNMNETVLWGAISHVTKYTVIVVNEKWTSLAVWSLRKNVASHYFVALLMANETAFAECCNESYAYLFWQKRITAVLMLWSSKSDRNLSANDATRFKESYLEGAVYCTVSIFANISTFAFTVKLSRFSLATHFVAQSEVEIDYTKKYICERNNVFLEWVKYVLFIT